MVAHVRLSAAIDPNLLAEGRRAVAAGRATDLDAWINEALHRQVAHDQRLRSLDEFLAQYESEHGEITDDEIDAAMERLAAQTTEVGSSRRNRIGRTAAP